MKITFEDKVTPQISDDYKITSDNMNHIKNVINTNDAYFETIRSYSTEEQIIGRWIDGKTLYRKVIYLDSISFKSGTNTIPVNISNLDTVISKKYAMFYPTVNRWYLNWDSIDTRNWTINGTNLQIDAASAATFTKFHVILEYTKN